MKKILNAYKEILNNSVKYIVPTTIIMFGFALPFAANYYLGTIACIVAICVVIPLFIGTINYCIDHDC
jgi:hypothetical protein